MLDNFIEEKIDDLKLKKTGKDMHTSHECLLEQVEKQEVEAREFGFYWERIEQLIEQVQSECREVQEAWEEGNRAHLQEEIGDLIQAAIGVAVFCNLDPCETLRQSIEKFQKRYDAVVQFAQRDGHTHLRQKPFELLMDYWHRAKQQEMN